MHTDQGEVAEFWMEERDGKRVWVFPDGRVVPCVQGWHKLPPLRPVEQQPTLDGMVLIAEKDADVFVNMGELFLH